MKVCAVINCLATDPLHANRSFYRLPKEKVLKEKWLRAIGLSEVRNMIVCDRHFNPNDIGLKRLKKNAYPSILLRIGSSSIHNPNSNTLKIYEFQENEEVQESVNIQEIQDIQEFQDTQEIQAYGTVTAGSLF
jgi:hypothetical protein